jgi:hypothetical protein
MAAFLTTSIATFATILIAYFGKYLPGADLNKVDHYILRKLKNMPESPRIRRMKHSVEAFILALSDQQLIKGLAILIAAFARCDVSVYSFSNASAIAWFSCTTHIATLTVLKRCRLIRSQIGTKVN